MFYQNFGFSFFSYFKESQKYLYKKILHVDLRNHLFGKIFKIYTKDKLSIEYNGIKENYV